jgi:hypothetical protein
MRTTITILLCLVTAATLAASGQDAETLANARKLQLEFRQGNLAVVDPLVKSLEAAVAQSPDNAELWEAMGNAYMSQLGSLSYSRDRGAPIAAAERARDAYARAMAGGSDDAVLLASHGMAGMLTSLLKGEHAAMKGSIDEMNAAVLKSPKSTMVRLTRGFTIIHLPQGVRDNAAVAEDLNFVLDSAPGGRAEDMVRVLLGDVYAESGDLAAARGEYEMVTGSSAFATEQVKLRMDELKQGRISPASIAKVRAGLGARCAMCHAPGNDG